MELVRWFDRIRLPDTPLVGGKGANLGELTAAGLPVPPGFVVTSEAYRAAVDAAGIRPELSALVAAGAGDDPAAVEATAARAQELVRGMPAPVDVVVAVLDAYRRLGEGAIVAVRSSGTTEDAADTSFAGMNATFTNVCGDDALLEAVRGCWASLYGARVLSYRSPASTRTPSPRWAWSSSRWSPRSGRG